MSDHLDDPADEPVETAQDAVEPNEPTSQEENTPFDGEFDPDRARRTIDHLRQREKELEQQAKQYERLQNDPDAFREFLSQRGYELPEEDDEPVFDTVDDDPISALKAEIEAIKAERAAEQLQARTFETAAAELDEIQKDIGRDLTEDEIVALTEIARPDKDGILHIKPAWDTVQKLTAGWQKQWTEGKKTARPPAAGTQGSEKFDIRDRDARIARMAAVMQANSD